MATTLQITHNDLDGCGCALLGRLMNITDCVYVAYNETSKYYFPKVLQETFSPEKYDNIIITDINLTSQFVEIMEKVIPHNVWVTSVDHHEDSIPCHTRWTIHHNKELSATKIMENLLDKKIDLSLYEDVLNAIDFFDTWQLDKSPMALNLQRTFHYHMFMNEEMKYTKFPQKLNNYVTLLQNEPPYNDGFIPKWYTKYLEEYTAQTSVLVRDVFDNKKVIQGIPLFVFEKGSNCPAFEVSVLTNEKNIEHFILLFQDDNTLTVSLRTNNSNIKCNEFALKKNGGGHASAASFRIPMNETILKNTLSEIVEFYRG